MGFLFYFIFIVLVKLKENLNIAWSKVRLKQKYLKPNGIYVNMNQFIYLNSHFSPVIRMKMRFLKSNRPHFVDFYGVIVHTQSEWWPIILYTQFQNTLAIFFVINKSWKSFDVIIANEFKWFLPMRMGVSFHKPFVYHSQRYVLTK